MQLRRLALAFTFVASIAHVPGFADTPAAPKPSAPGAGATIAAAPLLTKIAVLGASVSGGMGLDPKADPFQGQEPRLRLATVIDASIVGTHERPLDHSTLMFFASPEVTAKGSVEKALSEKPTAVVALDYLFWLGYGPGKENKRFERLELGLKALEAFTCPVLLGDIPDFNGAGVDPMMLQPQVIPASEVLAKLNERIAAWAKDKKNVVLVPAREMTRKLHHDETIEARGNRWEKGSISKLVQADGLHTTLAGTCAFWIIAVDAWLAAKPTGLDEKAFDLDAAKLAQKAGLALTAPIDPKAPAKPDKSKPKAKTGAGAGGG